MSEHVMTKQILTWFEEISKVPRESKHEEKIRAWVMKWAKEHDLEAKEDATGNIVIKVPASSGYESAPTLVIQGHLDMVCEKKPESNHDFTKDPIKLLYEGEWLTADKTTLGADNGIAMAMAFTLALSKDVGHPALELLFTVDEETGLTGATALGPGFIEGKILLNVDSEDEGYFTVGCAGGKDTKLEMPVETAEAPAGFKPYRIKIGELKGGHSGIDISGERGNAIRLLARTILGIAAKGEIRLADIKGGSAHNAIPRDASALVFIPEGDSAKVEKTIADYQETYRAEFKNTDPELTMKLVPEQYDGQVMTFESTKKAVEFIMAIPHGVEAMSTDIEGLIETSNNLATIELKSGHIVVISSQRSSVMSRLQELTDRIESVAHICGGKATSGGGYPAWQPNMDSPLLARCKEVYKNTFDKEPVVEAIHAGLECGIIGSKYEGMDMISFGPTIKNPHSPDEKIHIGSIGKVCDFMVALMKTYK